MDRPDQHVTDSLGRTQLRSVLEPAGWTLTEYANDYGIDFDVEVFRNNKTTGQTFKIQLKSSRSTRYSQNGHFVSETIALKNAEYLVRELKTPVCLVHADVEGRRTFWSAPQLDRLGLEDVLRSASGSITLRIPTSQSLPDTQAEMLEAISRVSIVLACRELNGTSATDFVALVKGQLDPQRLLKDLQSKAHALRLEEGWRAISAGELDAARPLLNAVIGDTDADIDDRFGALLASEELERRAAIRNKRTDQYRVNVGLEFARRLRELTNSASIHLKMYSVVLVKVRELDVCIQRMWNAWLQLSINKQHGTDRFWAAEVSFARAQSLRDVTLKLKQCYRLLLPEADGYPGFKSS